MTIIPWGRIALAAGVLGLLLWVGMGIRASGKQAGLDEGEQIRADLATELAHARAQGATCAGALTRVTEETDRGIREAHERAAAGERAAAEAGRVAEAARAEAARAKGALTAARRVPACKVQLEMTLCDDIPLL